MERADAAPHALEERIAAADQPHGRCCVLRRIAAAFGEHRAGGARARHKSIDRFQPACLPIGEQAVGQDIGNQHAIIAYRGDLPERKRLADREAKLRRQVRACERYVQARVERNIGRDLHAGSGQDRNLADRAGKCGDLRQRMHRLLEQDIDRSAEHPVAELPRGKLAQWHVVDAADEVRSSKGACLDHAPQLGEGGMIHEVLVDAERGGGPFRRLQQSPAFFAGRGEGFFDEHRLAGLEQRECDLRMPVRRHQDVGAIERVGGESIGQRRKNMRGAAGSGQFLGRGDGRIDDGRDPGRSDRSQRLGMHVRNIACADQGNAPHRVVVHVNWASEVWNGTSSATSSPGSREKSDSAGKAADVVCRRCPVLRPRGKARFGNVHKQRNFVRRFQNNATCSSFP